ncbi:formate/nitrite transporter family protein [Escherichia coli]
MKTTAPAMVLFFKGASCNWLVCLAIWGWRCALKGRRNLLCIRWRPPAFIASGYEHSIANMTLFALPGFRQPQRRWRVLVITCCG